MTRDTYYNPGFTLVELLVSMALIAVLLTSLISIQTSSARSSASLQSRNELLSETQIAQNYMAGKISNAAYIFSKTTILNLGTGYSTRKPGTLATDPNSGRWTIGTDSIVAFLLPPATGASGACTTANTDSCYTFYAYYPIERSVLTTNATGVNNPGIDSANDSTTWVIMEYRKNLSTVTTLSDALATSLNGNTGRMVLDYLRPLAGSETLFSQDDTKVAGVNNITFNLATQRFRGDTIKFPSTGRYSVTVYPRNIGKPVVTF